MKDITNQLGTLYYPKAGMLIYQSSGRNADTYVEYFDMDAQGHPINAHPLTINEADRLAKSLSSKPLSKQSYLRAKGILPSNVLHVDATRKQVLWYSKPQKRALLFSPALGLESGIASIPALLYKANENSLQIFALRSAKRPTESTALYHAPFFNVYQDAKVCMGTVDIDLDQMESLEEFIAHWESYFFGSYFSHLMEGHEPIKGNCVLLWESLIGTDKPFPLNVLKKAKQTIKNLLP